MTRNLSALVLVLTVTFANQAHAEQRCKPGLDLLTDSGAKSIVALKFVAPFIFKSPGSKEKIDKKTGWRKFWAKGYEISVSPGSSVQSIAAGTRIEFSNVYAAPGDPSSAISSSMILMKTKHGSSVEMIETLSQPYSAFKVRQLEKSLGAEAICK